MITKRTAMLAGTLLGYTALAFALFANVWASPATRWIGVDGDPDSTIWSIAWSAYSLVHGLNPFLTDYIFHPSGTDVLWSNADAPIALGWLVTPVTLTLGPIVAYNLLQTLALSFSAWTAYLAINQYVSRPPAALVGGLVYGFGPYVMGQAYGHMALTVGVVPPLLLILLDRLLVRRDASPLVIGALAGLLESFQFLTSVELVAGEALVVALCTVWLALIALVMRWHVPWAEVVRRGAVAGAAASLVFLALAGYPLYLLLRGPARVTHEPVRAFGTFVTDVFNLVIPPLGTHLLHNSWTAELSASFPGAPVESGAYVGIVMFAVLMFTALNWWRHPAVLFAAGSLAVVVLVSLGPHLMYGGHLSHRIVLPWALVRNVPILNELLVERLAMFADLFAGLLLAIFIDRMWESGWRPARPVAVVAVGASLALLVPSVPWASSDAHVPGLFRASTSANRYLHEAVPAGSTVVILPSDSYWPGYGYSMLWQAVDGLHFKMPEGDLVHGDSNGFSTFDPPPSPLWNAMSMLQHGIAPPTSATDLQLVRDQMAEIDVRAVVIGAMPHQELAIEYFTSVFGHPPVDMGDAVVWPTG